jgi:hypothetical protein
LVLLRVTVENPSFETGEPAFFLAEIAAAFFWMLLGIAEKE